MSETGKSSEHLPELLDVKILIEHFGFSRSMAYNILNMPACGVIQIGARRKYLHRDTFLKWLEEQASHKPNETM